MFIKLNQDKEMAKMYLAEGLISLMSRKNFEDISVTEICKRAGVSRMTYYRYFEDKHSILNYYMMKIIKNYITENKNAENSVDLHDFERIKECFVFFRRYSEFVMCLKKANLSSILLDELNKYMKEHEDKKNSGMTRTYQMYYFAGALYNVFMNWLEGGMKESEENMAQIIVNLTHQL